MNTPSAGLGRGKRKGRTATGDDKKGEQYWERRRKNNIAAKRSRDSRRAKDNQVHRTLTPLFFMLPLISNEYFNAYPTSMGTFFLELPRKKGHRLLFRVA